MKGKVKLTGFTVTLVLLLIAAITPAAAGVVWSDDFDDGDYNGWDSSWSVWEVVDGVLRCNIEDPYQYPIRHPSTVANGTWSFDIYHKDMEEQRATFMWLSGDPENNYYLRFVNSEIGLGSFIDGFVGVIDTCDVEINGWQQVDITRDTSGQFNVWINDTHLMQGVDTSLNSSLSFVVGLRDGGGIDNVVVSDTVDITPPETTTTTSPTTTTTSTDDTTPPDGIPLELLLGGVAVVVVIVLVVIVFKQRKL